MYMYLSLALTLAAGIGFVYGLFRFFRDESALYVRMIVFGVGCAMLGRLFATLLYLVNGDLFPASMSECWVLSEAFSSVQTSGRWIPSWAMVPRGSAKQGLSLL